MEQSKPSGQESLLDQITKPYFRNDLPSLEVGEKVEVIMKIQSQEKHNFSSFKGIIIAQKRKKQISHNFTVLDDESKKLVIKQTFFYHSPLIIKIKKLGRINQKVRQAKLYFYERKLSARKAGE